MRSVALAVFPMHPMWAHPSDDPDQQGKRRAPFSGRAPAKSESLPYKVELWNDAKNAVEQVLAETISASIGFAAYYAATKEYPDRYVTLKDKSGVLSRWNGPHQ